MDQKSEKKKFISPSFLPKHLLFFPCEDYPYDMEKDPKLPSKLKYAPLVSTHGIFSLPQAYEMASLGQGSLEWRMVGSSRARLIFINNDQLEFDIVMPRTHGFVEVQSIRGLEAHRQKYRSYWDTQPEPMDIKADLRR